MPPIAAAALPFIATAGKVASVATVAYSGYKAASTLFGGSEKQQQMTPLPVPQAPTVEPSQEVAAERTKRLRASRSQSIYTSPLGVEGEANIARKELLGI